jgi:hypothetical protein
MTTSQWHDETLLSNVCQLILVLISQYRGIRPCTGSRYPNPGAILRVRDSKLPRCGTSYLVPLRLLTPPNWLKLARPSKKPSLGSDFIQPNIHSLRITLLNDAFHGIPERAEFACASEVYVSAVLSVLSMTTASAFREVACEEAALN